MDPSPFHTVTVLQAPFRCSCNEISHVVEASSFDEAAVLFAEWAWEHADGFEWLTPSATIAVALEDRTEQVTIAPAGTPRFTVQ